MLFGTVSAANKRVHSDYVAYVDDQSLKSPRELWIDLEDGKIAITNDTYQSAMWPVNGLGHSYLQPKEPVVVVGYLEHSRILTTGDEIVSVNAGIVYAGGHDDFRKRARIKQYMAAALIFADPVGIFIVLVMPLRRCIIGMRSKRDVQREA